jgi:hypothetical protein
MLPLFVAGQRFSWAAFRVFWYVVVGYKRPRGDMVEYDIVPHEGIGPLAFGMSREQSRAAMGTTPETFRDSGQDASETDAYHKAAFQVFFGQDKVEYMELSADESVTAMYKGHDVFKTKAQDLVNFISQEAP